MSTVTDYEPRTYRGSALEDVLPRIRAELGPDAIVVRQRQGLDGGIGGFFQRRCVEVVARRPTPSLDAYDEQDDLATARSRQELPSPGIQEIMRVASPFIDQLRPADGSLPAMPESPFAATVAAAQAEHPFAAAVAAAQAEAATAEHRVLAAPARRDPLSAFLAAEPPAATWAEPAFGLPYTGAFGTSAYALSSGAAALAERPVAAPAPRPATPAPAQPAPAPLLQLVPSAAERAPLPAGGAAALQRTLADAGISPRLAAELVDHTTSHVLPFGPDRELGRALAGELARRIPVAPPPAPGARAIAFVGAGGSGKTLCVARLAAAYALHSDRDVTVMSLAAPERSIPLREALTPAGVEVLDARAGDARLAAGDRALTVVDTPAVSPARSGEVAELAAELERLGAPEVHVVVPATLSGPAVRALLDGFAALAPAAIVLTHLDELGHAGPVVEEAVARGVAISYTSDGGTAEGFAPADPAALATRLLA